MKSGKRFIFYRQLNAMDCGPTCLKMIARWYGVSFNIDSLRHSAGFSKTGVSMLGISETAEQIGFRTRGMQLSPAQLRDVHLPCIVHWNQNHFVVLIRYSASVVKVADPAKGIISYTHNEFLQHWLSNHADNGAQKGTVLLLEPGPQFYQQQGEKEKGISWKLVLQYLTRSRWQIVQVFIALLFGSLIQLIFPFLTQSVVDIGISSQNLQFIVVILLAQLMLAFSKTIVEFIRSRLLLRISNILNIQVLSDFWIKLTRLPVSYFDVHHTGDTLQRINDHKQIQLFLTGPALSTLFSVFNFVVYAIVLIMYDVSLFFVFCIGSIIYFSWITFFLRIRRKLNYQTFHLASRENNATLQLIQGMQELRLNNAEKLKRWEWENIQSSVFRLNFKSLHYSQWQDAGATLINQVQGILISFLVARLVISGHLTLGEMLAVQYIIGQLSSPIQQWVGFVQSAQDAKISMERLNEIHQLPDEENPEQTYIKQLPDNKSILVQGLSFTYPGAGNEPVLNNIYLHIPEKKVTAVVGASGSGKTTLVKLLLKVYTQFSGEIRVGANTIDSGEGDGLRFGMLSHSYWRSACGAVLQDGYIFNDTIMRNIAVSEETIDEQKLLHSCRIANIHSFIETLPNGYHTMLGANGTGLSQGQRQRLLIARAVYKDPAYLFFDEATNALDANNERKITENLEQFFKGRTVLIVAHRLSTVKNADKIVVLDKGKIVEEGTHQSLTALKGKYYALVKNQLELGN